MTTGSNHVLIRPATSKDVYFIARGFHMAMLYENPDEQHIKEMAEEVCTREDVLYSWHNTLIAEVDGEAVGILTAYDGRNYREWKKTTFQILDTLWGVRFTNMEDEAAPGEYYIDSLAVLPRFRGQGIGTTLLKKGITSGKALGLLVTIAVDPINEKAIKLYRSLGFNDEGELFIFGHTYKKMVL